MSLTFFRQRTIWWPTLLTWTCLLVIGGGFCLLWWCKGESFLSLTERQPADVLVVEGWIGSLGVRSAQAEFGQGGYHYIVATGSLTGARWDARRWSYATEAEEQLLRRGVPRDQVILAVPKDTEVQRTFESAVAVREALRARGIQPTAINVLTRGPHARRSRLIFAKVFESQAKVGVIAWLPPGYETEPWWHFSDRIEDLLKETVGYGYELFLNSGRLSNSPAPAKP